MDFLTPDCTLTRKQTHFIKKNKLKRNQYEFQMLLGVKGNLLGELSKKYVARVYVPYGPWKLARGYSERRMRENPMIAWYILRNLLP